MEWIVTDLGIKNVPDAVVVYDSAMQAAFAAKGYKKDAEIGDIGKKVKQMAGIKDDNSQK